MQNLKYLIGLLMIAFLLPACGDDEDPNSIEGKWNVVYFSAINCDDPEDNVTIDFLDDPCISEGGFEICFDMEIEFQEDGDMLFTINSTFQGTPNTDVEEYTYSIAGNELTVCETPTECSVSNFTLNGNTMTFAFIDEDGCNISLNLQRN